MTTILDVEKKSGVSRSTISRYLNGKKVKPENAKKIEQTIKELAFKRNPMASGLRTNKTYTVGCVLPDITDPFFPSIISVFQEQMLKNGYQTIFNTYGNNLSLEVDQVQALADKQVDGLVIATGLRDGAHLQNCLNSGIPVIQLDRRIEGLECDSITVDNYDSVFDAISLAIRKGHRKIGCVRGVEVYTDDVRFDGFVKALNKGGIELREEYVVEAELTEHDAARQFMHLMNLADPPTLIFCSNVYHSMGALEAMLEYNLRVPEDISILTFDRLSSIPYYGFTSSIKPTFSSICQPLEKIGKKAAELMLKRLNRETENYKPIHLQLKTTFYMTDSIADITKKN